MVSTKTGFSMPADEVSSLIPLLQDARSGSSKVCMEHPIRIRFGE